MAIAQNSDKSQIIAARELTLGQAAFIRTNDGSEVMNINGEAAGTPVNVWNGTGGGDTGVDWAVAGTGSESPAADSGAGTNGWDTGVTGQNDKVTFDNGSLFDPDALYADLQLQLNPQAWPALSRLRIGFLDASNTLVGQWRRIENYTANMDTGIWQQVAVPVSDFNLAGAQAQKICIECRTTAGQHHYFDDIKLVPAGGAGPYRFQVQAPVGECFHVSMLVLMVSGPSAGWNPENFANISPLSKGLILRQRALDTGDVAWKFNSKDNLDLFGRYHPQDDIQFADGTLLVGFMVKPGKSSIVVSNNDVLEFVVRDDLSTVSAARAFCHFGREVIVV